MPMLDGKEMERRLKEILNKTDEEAEETEETNKQRLSGQIGWE